MARRRRWRGGRGAAGGGGEATQGEPLPEGHASPIARAEETPTESFADNVAQEAARTTTAEGEIHGPATAVAGETDTFARQTSPGILLNNSSFLLRSNCFHWFLYSL